MNANAILDKDQQEVVRLQGIIAAALKAMDDGCYGDARRILKTGRAGPVLAVTGILTKGEA
jgi:hypothetical protein